MLSSPISTLENMAYSSILVSRFSLIKKRMLHISVYQTYPISPIKVNISQSMDRLMPCPNLSVLFFVLRPMFVFPMYFARGTSPSSSCVCILLPSKQRTIAFRYFKLFCALPSDILHLATRLENQSYRKESSRKGLRTSPTSPQRQGNLGVNDYRRK